EYERLRRLLSGAQEPSPLVPEDAPRIPPGIRRSQVALRRALPQLLAVRKLLGRWVCYAGAECIGIAPWMAALVRAFLACGRDGDAFYVGRSEPHELVEEEELGPPPPSLMVDEEESIHP